MADFNPMDHPRGPDGKFSGNGGRTRGSQRRLERVGEAIGKAVRGAFVGEKPRKAPPKPDAYSANGGWGVYRNEAEFDSFATRYESGKLTPAQRRRHERQVDAYRRA